MSVLNMGQILTHVMGQILTHIRIADQRKRIRSL